MMSLSKFSERPQDSDLPSSSCHSLTYPPKRRSGRPQINHTLLNFENFAFDHPFLSVMAAIPKINLKDL